MPTICLPPPLWWAACWPLCYTCNRCSCQPSGPHSAALALPSVCLQSLAHEIANFGQQRDSRVKAAQAKIAAAKKAVEGAKKALKAKQAAMQVG